MNPEKFKWGITCVVDLPEGEPNDSDWIGLRIFEELEAHDAPDACDESENDEDCDALECASEKQGANDEEVELSSSSIGIEHGEQLASPLQSGHPGEMLK